LILKKIEKNYTDIFPIENHILDHWPLEFLKNPQLENIKASSVLCRNRNFCVGSANQKIKFLKWHFDDKKRQKMRNQLFSEDGIINFR
jgi:hypothetical protein